MNLVETIEYHLIESLTGTSAFSAPPEPSSPGLMQRSPYDRDSLVSESLQLCGDGINISYCGLVLFGSLLHSPTHVEVGLICVECTWLLVSSHGGEPMPENCNYTFSIWAFIKINGPLNWAIVPTGPIWMPGVVRRVVLQIKTLDNRSPSSQGVDILNFTRIGELSTDDMTSIWIL